MDNFVSLFNEIYIKFMDKYYQGVSDSTKGFKLTEREEFYLDIIYKNKKITLSDFAAQSKITKPAATQIVNKFIKDNYVIKTTSSLDKRVCYIELSEDTEKYLINSYEKLNNLYNECLSFLSKEEIDNLNDILLKINRNL